MGNVETETVLGAFSGFVLSEATMQWASKMLRLTWLQTITSNLSIYAKDFRYCGRKSCSFSVPLSSDSGTIGNLLAGWVLIGLPMYLTYERRAAAGGSRTEIERKEQARESFPSERIYI